MRPATILTLLAATAIAAPINLGALGNDANGHGISVVKRSNAALDVVAVLAHPVRRSPEPEPEPISLGNIGKAFKSAGNNIKGIAKGAAGLLRGNAAAR